MSVNHAKIDLGAAQSYLSEAMDAIRNNNIKLAVYLCGRTIRELASAITNLTTSDE